VKYPIAQRLKLALKMLRGGSFTLMDDAALEAFGGSHRLLADWVLGGGDINDEIRGDMRRVRARARDLAKSNAYIKQFLNMVSVNVIGPNGFALNAMIENGRGKLLTSVNDKIEAAWDEWASGPITVDGKLNLTAAQMMLAKHVVRDGEAFVRVWRDWPENEYGTALEIIDPDVVDETLNENRQNGGRRINMGIEVDDFGKPLAYHVWTEADSQLVSNRRKRVSIPAPDIIHLFLPDRVAQVRGYTCFYPAMIPARMLRGYTQAELVAARASAAKLGFLETNTDGPPPADIGGKDNANALSIPANPGTIEMLPPGLKFTSWDPQHPTTAFPEFVKGVLREIATGLGVSYNALANDLEGVNYSSMRSGLLIERDLWKVFQTWWCFGFLRPLYEQWLNVALLKGSLSLGSRDFRQYRRIRWTGRGYRWVDPLKDAQAGIMAIKSGLASRTQLLDEQGLDIETVFRQLRNEQDLAAEIGITIVDQNPTSVINEPQTSTNGNGKSARNRLSFAEVDE